MNTLQSAQKSKQNTIAKTIHAEEITRNNIKIQFKK